MLLKGLHQETQSCHLSAHYKRSVISCHFCQTGILKYYIPKITITSWCVSIFLPYLNIITIIFKPWPLITGMIGMTNTKVYIYSKVLVIYNISQCSTPIIWAYYLKPSCQIKLMSWCFEYSRITETSERFHHQLLKKPPSPHLSSCYKWSHSNNCLLFSITVLRALLFIDQAVWFPNFNFCSTRLIMNIIIIKHEYFHCTLR